ncbi:hypothetical protein [Sphingomonas sp. ID0503]|uniref:hypothetical protein n=1 Tax=Sphingomonas sp. ID0503 TaxID=3399691 RepID=UPI003AFACA33
MRRASDGGGGESHDALGVWYKTPEALENWLRTAEPGDEFTYAHASMLRPEPIVAAVAALVKEGEVQPAQRMNGCGKHYIIQRTSGERRTAPVRPARRTVAALPAEEQRVYLILGNAARAGRVCPSNSALVRLAGLTTRQQAAHLIEKLAMRRGLIAVETVMTAAGPGRIVTMVRSGRRTADPRGVSVPQPAASGAQG